MQVRYFTQDVTAKSGEHYNFKSGTVTFSPGQRSKTVPVTLINDLEDDPYKTFTMRIHNVTGADAEIGLAVVDGSITNSETYPLAGFLLVDAETQTVLATLTHDVDASVTLDDPTGGEFAFRAVSPPDAEIGSVRLELTGARTASRTLNAEPWSLYGNDGGDLQGESLPAGAYTLTATVYSEADLGGEVVQTLSVSFTVAATGGDNNPVTGAPTISGTAQVGQTLTADTSGIADADGLDNAVFSYQWTRNDGTDDADIRDANGATYTLVSADEGKTIRVRVSFTDDASNGETLTSAATATVAAATVPGEPGHLRVFPHDAQGLDLSWEAPTSDGGSPITGYKVQWKEEADSWETPEDVSETTVTGTTHTINGLTDGLEYTVRVLASNGVGDGGPSDEETGTPRETAPPELSTAAADGAALTLTYNEALDGGSTPATSAFSVRVGGADRTVDAVAVSGSAVTLTLASAVTAGDTVTVSYTAPTGASATPILDLAGNAAASFSGESVTNNTAEAQEEPPDNSEDTQEPQEPPPAPQNLTAAENEDGSVTLTWDAPDDDSVTGYQILRRRPSENEHALSVYVADTGSTATTYTDTDVTAGTLYVYRVKAINDAGVGPKSRRVMITTSG